MLQSQQTVAYSVAYVYKKSQSHFCLLKYSETAHINVYGFYLRCTVHVRSMYVWLQGGIILINNILSNLKKNGDLPVERGFSALLRCVQPTQLMAPWSKCVAAAYTPITYTPTTITAELYMYIKLRELEVDSQTSTHAKDISVKTTEDSKSIWTDIFTIRAALQNRHHMMCDTQIKRRRWRWCKTALPRALDRRRHG